MAKETRLIPMPKDELDKLARCAGGLSSTVMNAIIKLDIVINMHSGKMPDHVALSLQETLDILKNGREEYDTI